ncbi:hypothetical protein ACQ4M3_10945 [Leptolyngbya sp. AN03gr2]|uniref:hypothetical protein n=1 Tax=unclassified Leptolyngbya TaxID=2650499 RepID=UPI003D312E28
MAQATLNQILNQLDTLEPEELEQLTQAIHQRLSEQKKEKTNQQVADLIPANQDCPAWSPYDAFEAAEIMLKALQDANTQEESFWLQSTQSSLDAIWDNEEDDIYAQLLETGEQTNG